MNFFVFFYKKTYNEIIIFATKGKIMVKDENITKKNKTEKKLRVVISPMVANKLCERGFYIVKIKPKRKPECDDYNCSTVFLFEETEAFLKEFYALTKK